MTSTTPPTPDSDDGQTDDDTQTTNFFLWPDYLLDDLCQLAEFDSHEIPLTVTLSGQTITGTLVSPEAFAALGLAHLKNVPHPTPDAARRRFALEDMLEKQAAKARRDTERRRPQQPDDRHMKIYLHLRDAELVLADGSTRALGHWRGRTIHVTGWTLGPA